MSDSEEYEDYGCDSDAAYDESGDMEVDEYSFDPAEDVDVSSRRVSLSVCLCCASENMQQSTLFWDCAAK